MHSQAKLQDKRRSKIELTCRWSCPKSATTQPHKTTNPSPRSTLLSSYSPISIGKNHSQKLINNNPNSSQWSDVQPDKAKRKKPQNLNINLQDICYTPPEPIKSRAQYLVGRKTCNTPLFGNQGLDETVSYKQHVKMNKSLVRHSSTHLGSIQEIPQEGIYDQIMDSIRLGKRQHHDRFQNSLKLGVSSFSQSNNTLQNEQVEKAYCATQFHNQIGSSSICNISKFHKTYSLQLGQQKPKTSNSANCTNSRQIQESIQLIKYLVVNLKEKLKYNAKLYQIHLLVDSLEAELKNEPPAPVRQERTYAYEIQHQINSVSIHKQNQRTASQSIKITPTIGVGNILNSEAGGKTINKTIAPTKSTASPLREIGKNTHHRMASRY